MYPDILVQTSLHGLHNLFLSHWHYHHVFLIFVRHRVSMVTQATYPHQATTRMYAAHRPTAQELDLCRTENALVGTWS